MIESSEALERETTRARRAGERAAACREALASARRRAERREAFRLWRLRVSADTAAARARAAEAERTVRAVRSGYEVQLERTQHLCDLAVSRANKRAEAAEVAATGRARAAPASGRKRTRKVTARERCISTVPKTTLGRSWATTARARRRARWRAPSLPSARARERAALEAADARIQKVDAYYARQERGEADAARTAETRAEFREARRDASDSVSSSSRRASGDDRARRATRARVRGGGRR